MMVELIQKRSNGQSGPVADNRPADPSHADAAAVRRMQRYVELTGLSFMCVDSATALVLAKSDAGMLPLLPEAVCVELSAVTGPRVIEHSSGLLFHVLPLPSSGDSSTGSGNPLVAVGFVFSRPGLKPPELVLAAAEENWSQDRLERWLAGQTVSTADDLEKLLAMAAGQVAAEERMAILQIEIDQLSDHIDQTYEEIALLHSLTQNLQISRSPSELAELCLSRMHELIRSDGNAIWIEEKKGAPQFQIKGTIPFDELGLAQLVSRFELRDWSRPLVKNHIERTLLGADFPGLRNLVIVPIAEGPFRSGWILSCNAPPGREFGTVEASLLNSIATILGTHVRNIDLYEQHNELLLSFVRSLVSTLDAKDPYTRGHSERVALIARRLGEEFDLPEDDLHDIYLSGLLHDVGKIGVNDSILQKPGTLTDEEFKKIQTHPMIGYQILQGLKNLQKILPGVRNHHEAYNGKGYPDGLKGEDIPLMARILAVADSYDAMGSDRPYRQGMPLEKIEEIFHRGAGNQWDAAVIEAYFRIRDEIRQICEDYSPTQGNLLEHQTAG